jgi:cyanophycinase
MSGHTVRVLVWGCCLLLSATVASAEESEAPRGSLMLIGGSERDSNELLWSELARLAGGRGGTVAVFATASSFPERTGRLFAAHLRTLGLDPFVVPASPLLTGVDHRQIVRDPEWIDRVKHADAVFLAGGEQARYREVLVDDDGAETPLLQAIRHVYQRGGLVAGTSAGTAVMSRVMFIDAEQILPVLQHGARMGREVDRGLGFLPADWFVDQHFLTRGRFGRSLVAMQTYSFPYGLGIDEDTALVIEQGQRARVVGYRGVVVMDASAAVIDSDEPRFNTGNVLLHYLSHGDTLDLRGRQVDVAPQKRDEHRIDPQAPGFKAYYQHKQFSNDVFGNTQLLDLMYKLVDSPHDEALGLAFDGAAAREGSTPGFEFRFRRGPGTVSWDSPEAIGDPYTVLNIRLDIRPITIQGPLYR